MRWGDRLRRAVRDAATSGDVVAPVNGRIAVNVGDDEDGGTTTTAAAAQHVEIRQTGRGRRDPRR